MLGSAVGGKAARFCLASLVFFGLPLLTARSTKATNLPAPALTTPANQGSNASPIWTFRWSAVKKARGYRIAISASAAALPTDPTLSSCGACVVSSKTPPGVTEYTPIAGALNSNTTYYWTVRALGAGPRYGRWAPVSSFITQPAGNVPAPSPTPSVQTPAACCQVCEVFFRWWDVAAFLLLAVIHTGSWLELEHLGKLNKEQDAQARQSGAQMMTASSAAGIAAVSILVPAWIIIVQLSSNSTSFPLVAVSNIFRGALWFLASLLLGLFVVFFGAFEESFD